MPFIIDLIFGGWKKYVAIGVGVAGLAAGAYILYLRAENAQLERDVVVYKANFEQCKTINESNAEATRRLKADADRAIAELSGELKRKTEEKEKVKVVRKIIREKAQECVGVNPADRAAAEWLRSRTTLEKPASPPATGHPGKTSQ